jgi:uncharacterized protein with PQ loop repeat
MKWLGMIAAIAMPLWNIPLIIKIERRKSSKDISAAWAVGVFACILLMLPSGLTSPDPVFRIFTLINTVLFGAVALQVLRYRK